MQCIRNLDSSSPFTAAALVCGRLPPKWCFNNVNEIISLLGSKPSAELHSIESKAETLQWRSPLGPPTPPWTHLPVLLSVVRPGGLYLEHLPQTPAWFTLSPSPNCCPNNCPAVRPTLYRSNPSPHQHLFQTPWLGSVVRSISILQHTKQFTYSCYSFLLFFPSTRALHPRRGRSSARCSRMYAGCLQHRRRSVTVRSVSGWRGDPGSLSLTSFLSKCYPHF